ncbi:endo-1,4-beta-xylanase [Botrimarina hoheduenensis]|uniref:Beta-xylanase n=1 Tax=Botrimarina hoheduenensis TaxID=2528000 RepID=A0A5C5WA12_9BACT|nr:endo-1,4-beta-xylanase [Botrimarina hoheduenensis]TWT47718.1 Endo-1,4-beta-xylanase Z precursor [Botrimarina hoheduenensis]
MPSSAPLRLSSRNSMPLVNPSSSLAGVRITASRIAVSLVVGLVMTSSAESAELVLSDFNGTGFDYTFSGFNQTIGATGVRLTDPTDNSGGAGIGLGSLNLNSFANGRLVIDVTPLVGNGANRFDLELIESSTNGQTSRSGKWSFDVSSLTPGVPTTLVSRTTLDAPDTGIGDFQNLNLGQISTWQVLGDFTTAAPFDFSFDRVAISTDVAPPPAYPGAEPNAPWRTQAASQIEVVRKADFAVSVVDAAGNPVPSATVQFNMREHEFGFGSAVQAFRLRDNQPQHATYKSFTSQLFNLATIENNLKWPAWEGEWGGLWTQQGALAALDWLDQQGLDARGHVMVWPGKDNLPQDLRQMLADNDLNPAEQTAVRNRIAAHIASIAAATNGKLAGWDVINETRTNNDLMRELSEGDQAMVTWFQQAAAAAGEADLYINDFGILNNWGAGNNRNQYFNTIQQLQAQGAPVEGIGFQGHFVESDISGPEQIWEVLDQFQQLGLKMQITEFDFDTTDEQLQADYLRDFMTAVFAHEGIDDFIMWGFWEDAHWKPDAAMFRSDWSIKPNGEAYLDLVYNQWWTDESTTTDALGETSARGFKGDYLVTASARGESVSQTATLSTDGALLTIVLPFLVGDYNNDGFVDAADYTVWRDSKDTTVTPGTGADGNGDGFINQADYLIWNNNFGAAFPPAAAVPEPASAVALALMTIIASGRRRG